MYFLESRKHLKNQELDPSLVRDRQGFASRKHVAWACFRVLQGFYVISDNIVCKFQLEHLNS